MSIKMLFEISKEFFDSIYSQGIDFEDDNVDINEKTDQENDIEYDEEVCYCNICCVYRTFLSVLNHNKVD
jgi:hypothetical protein